MEFPPSEIKTAGIEESKVLNATMDISSQNKRVAPDYDDVVSLHFTTNTCLAPFENRFLARTLLLITTD